jgi:membrane protein implicated in regulation of membrane protease activity
MKWRAKLFKESDIRSFNESRIKEEIRIDKITIWPILGFIGIILLAFFGDVLRGSTNLSAAAFGASFFLFLSVLFLVLYLRQLSLLKSRLRRSDRNSKQANF